MQTLETVLCSTTLLSPGMKTNFSMDQRTSNINLRLKKPLFSPVGTDLEKSEQLPKSGLATFSLKTENHQQSLINGSLISVGNGTKINGNCKLNGKMTMSPEIAKHSISNGSVEFKPLNNSVTIRNGTIRLLSNGSSSGSKNIQSFKCLAEFKEGNSFKASSISPSNDTFRNLKKVKMSTVAKRVPLINTVGNHSKLIPLTLPLQNQVPASTADSFTSTAPTKNVSKPMSILEARLTCSDPSPTNNLQSQQSEKICANSCEDPSVSLLQSPAQKLHSSKEPLLKRTGISHEDSPEDSEAVPSKKLKTLQLGNQEKKSCKAVFGFERGLTRLVAVESRTVTMVDVGMQVFIPGEYDMEGKDPPPLAVSPVSSGVTQASTTSAVPMNNKQFLVVDTKSGKKVLAIPKSVLGSKTVVVGGCTNTQLDSTCPISLGSQCTLESNNQTSAEVQVNETELSHGTGLARNTPRQIKGVTLLNEKDKSQMPSLSTDTVTTPSSGALSSITTPILMPNISPNPSTISEFCPTFSQSIPTCSVNGSGSIQTLSLQANTSDKMVTVTTNSLILPFNSPIKFEGRSFVNDTSLLGSKSVVLSQSCMSQSETFLSDSSTLPLKSSIQTSVQSPNSNSSVHVSPNISSLVILVPSSLNQDPIESDNSELNHEVGEADPALLKFINRGFKRKPFQSPLAKRKCAEAPAPEKIEGVGFVMKATSASNVSRHSREYADGKCPIATSNRVLQNNEQGSSPQTHRSTLQGDSINEGSGSNNGGVINGIGKEELNKYVRNAFLDFKNCLTVDKAGKFPIHVAVENNDFAGVKRQCIVLKARRVSVDIPNSKDETPLQLALYYGYSSIVKLLLQQGADATVSDPDGNSTLHLSVLHADEALESLLQCEQLDKRTMDILNDEGFSALHLAAQLDKVKAINLLIKYGAEVDLPDGKSGRTALYHAAERKHYKAQKCLVDNGADMREPTFTGSTPFTITRSDAIAQLTSGENTIAEEIDSDSLLLPSKRKNIRSK